MFAFQPSIPERRSVGGGGLSLATSLGDLFSVPEHRPAEPEAAGARVSHQENREETFRGAPQNIRRNVKADAERNREDQLAVPAEPGALHGRHHAVFGN